MSKQLIFAGAALALLAVGTTSFVVFANHKNSKLPLAEAAIGSKQEKPLLSAQSVSVAQGSTGLRGVTLSAPQSQAKNVEVGAEPTRDMLHEGVEPLRSAQGVQSQPTTPSSHNSVESRAQFTGPEVIANTTKADRGAHTGSMASIAPIAAQEPRAVASKSRMTAPVPAPKEAQIAAQQPPQPKAGEVVVVTGRRPQQMAHVDIDSIGRGNSLTIQLPSKR